MKFLDIKNTFKMALFFGFFQFIMPVIGYYAGIGFKSKIEAYDHWISFILLFVIGIKMVYESYKIKDIECNEKKCPFGYQTLIILAIATSIDALAIGITFALLKNSIISAVIIIGIVAFSMSIIGIYSGFKGKKLFGEKMELFGGIILIFIGFRILLSHILQWN